MVLSPALTAIAITRALWCYLCLALTAIAVAMVLLPVLTAIALTCYLLRVTIQDLLAHHLRIDFVFSNVS